jgi:hypothetical protein
MSINFASFCKLTKFVDDFLGGMYSFRNLDGLGSDDDAPGVSTYTSTIGGFVHCFFGCDVDPTDSLGGVIILCNSYLQLMSSALYSVHLAL